MKLRLFLLLFLIAAAASGQTMEWSGPQKIPERGFVSQVAGQTPAGLYILEKSYRSDVRNIYLEKYSGNLHHVDVRSYVNGKNERFGDLQVFDDRIHLYFTSYNKDTHETEVWLKRLDPNLNESSKDSLLISAGGKVEKNINILHQKNYPYTLILFSDQDIDIPSSYKYFVLDNGNRILKSGNFNIDITSKYEIEQAVFTTTRVAMLVREDVKRKINKQGYQFYVLHGPLDGGELTKDALFNDSTGLTEGLLKTDFINKTFVMAGIYNAKDSSYIKGYYLWKEPFSGGTAMHKIVAFPKKIVDEMAGKISKINGIFNLRAGTLTLRADGGLVLTTEEYQETRESIMDMNMGGISQSNFRYYYYYENLLVLSLSDSGNVDWHTVLKKEQVSVNDDGIYSSYVMAVTPEKIYFIYNDLSRKSWNLSMYEIDKKGMAKNTILIKAQDYLNRVVPQYGDQVSYNELAIPGYSGKGEVTLRIKF